MRNVLRSIKRSLRFLYKIECFVLAHNTFCTCNYFNHGLLVISLNCFQTQAEVEAALRTSWSKFSKVRKQPYIKAAQELNEKNIAAYRVAMEKNNFVVHDSVSEV